MRTPVKILTPTEKKALCARPGECAAPRHVDVVDERANMRTVHTYEQKADGVKRFEGGSSRSLEKRTRTSDQVGRCG